MATAKAQEYLRKKQAGEDERQRAEAHPLNDDFIVEPDLETVLGVLIPKQLHLMVYTALLDSQASEHEPVWLPRRLLRIMPMNSCVN